MPTEEIVSNKRRSYQSRLSTDTESSIPRKVWFKKKSVPMANENNGAQMPQDQFNILMKSITAINSKLENHQTQLMSLGGSPRLTPNQGGVHFNVDPKYVNTKRGSGSKLRPVEAPIAGASSGAISKFSRPAKQGDQYRNQNRGRGRGQFRGRGNWVPNSQSRQTQHKQRRHTMVEEIDLEDEGEMNEYEGQWQQRPRRASQGDTQRYSKNDLTRLVRREITNQKCHDEAASYDIILDGVPSYEGDDEGTEIQRAMEKLCQILPEFKRDYIKDCDRFFNPADDGTYPLKVSIKYPSIVQALTERARVDPKFHWFRPSRSKDMRKKIAFEEREVARLNANLPPNSPTRWEVLFLGVGVIRRRVPNPEYIPLKNDQNYGRPQGTTTTNLPQGADSATYETDQAMKTLNLSP